MPHIPLNLSQYNPTAQQALRALKDQLPDGFYVHSMGKDISIAYPEAVEQESARKSVDSALRAVHEQFPSHGIILSSTAG